MRIRTILAAAAAPAALAAVLLGTAGQASAAVTPAVLTASVQQQSVSATTHENGLADTTGANTGYYVDGNGNLTTDPSQSVYGAAWATDNVERQLTATQTAPGVWTVTLHTVGSYSAFANPIDGTPWTGQGRIDTTSYWTVTGGMPSKGNLAGQTDPSLRSQDVVAKFFGLVKNDPHVVMQAGNNVWDYYGIPGGTGPNGLYEQTG